MSAALSKPEPPPPTRLFALAESGYGKTLLVDPDAIYLMTKDAAYRLIVGREPVKLPLALGEGPAATRSAFVFWSDGAIFQASKKDGKARRVAPLAHQPQRFVASGEHFAWLDHADDGRFTVQTLEGKKPRVLYTSRVEVDTIAMLDELIVLVERAADSTWRFAAVSRNGGAPTYSKEHSGRTPAMLAVEKELYYYDGNAFEIRRLARDLASETTLVKGQICSPIAVAERIYCASVEGPFEISEQTPTPRRLAPEGGRTLTALAAGPGRVAWIREEGAEALAVETVSVSNAAPAAP